MVFSVPSFLGVGDDYDKKKVVDKRSVGRNFAVPVPKKGNGPDAMIGVCARGESSDVAESSPDQGKP